MSDRNEGGRKLAIECIGHAINDVQATVRAYDVKAEILGVLLTLMIGMINLHFLAESTDRRIIIFATLVCLMGIVAIFLLGMVLYPVKDVWGKLQLGSYRPSRVYFLPEQGSAPDCSVSHYSEMALNADWVSELMYELTKISCIRDRKHRFFLYALRVSGIAWALVVILLVAALC